MRQVRQRRQILLYNHDLESPEFSEGCSPCPSGVPGASDVAKSLRMKDCWLSGQP